MPYLFRFRPKPRCLRDRWELWIIRQHDGALYMFNMAGLIPYVLVPVGFIIGIIVSYSINGQRDLGWDAPVRFMPMLPGPALGVLLGIVIRFAIILHHYVDDEFSEAELETAQQFAQRAGKPRKKKSRKRQRVLNDE